jgi:hypothetical protein
MVELHTKAALIPFGTLHRWLRYAQVEVDVCTCQCRNRIQVHQLITKAEFLLNMKRAKKKERKKEEKSIKIQVMLLPSAATSVSSSPSYVLGSKLVTASRPLHLIAALS